MSLLHIRIATPLYTIYWWSLLQINVRQIYYYINRLSLVLDCNIHKTDQIQNNLMMENVFVKMLIYFKRIINQLTLKWEVQQLLHSG